MGKKVDQTNLAVRRMAEFGQLVEDHDKLRDALESILPLAEDFLCSAPSHPDNAKLESARAALAATRKRS